MINAHFSFQLRLHGFPAACCNSSPFVYFNDRTVSSPHYLSTTFYGIALTKRVKGVFIEASKHIVIMGGQVAYIGGIYLEGHLGAWWLFAKALFKSKRLLFLTTKLWHI